jgi:hypothetical protein
VLHRSIYKGCAATTYATGGSQKPNRLDAC